MNTNIGEGCAVWSVEQRKREIPLLVARIVLEAICSKNFCGKTDSVRILFDNRDWPVHNLDFAIAEKIAEQTKVCLKHYTGRDLCFSSPADVIEIIDFAQKQYAKLIDIRAGKRGLIMLSDNDGCGFWRMRLPAKCMKMDGWYADITSAPVEYEQLLEYDTIFVQRFHEWSAFYVLERLKQAGKRIIYDIDDDIFSIPRDNPAANVIRKDQQFAALEIMKLADTVIVSTTVLRDRLEQDMALRSKIVVIPNALELEGWNPTPMCGSPDGIKRIFWQGGSTHAEDWTVCINGVEQVMKELVDVRLVILGFLPPVVMNMVLRNNWQSRVEYMGFSEPETYYQMVKCVRAEVGLAPLQDNRFNAAKCIDASMRITTNKGIIKAGNIKSGMKVWRNGWKRVEAVNVESPKRGIVIETKSGYVLRLSQEHRMSINGKWELAKNISIGSLMDMGAEDSETTDIIDVPWPPDSRMNKTGRPQVDGKRRYSSHDHCAFLTAPDCPKMAITPRLGRILGAYVGDGSVGQGTQLRISCDGQDQDWIDLLVDDFSKIGLNPQTEFITTFGGEILRRREVRVASAHLIRVLEGMGLARQRENGKPIKIPCVPDAIWHSPKSVVSEFIAGYFEADGTVHRSGIGATSKDESLLRDIQRILLIFGIKSRLSCREHKCREFVGVYWHLDMGRDAASVFNKEIGFRSSRKSERLATIMKKRHSNAFHPMKWQDEVVSIAPCDIVPVDIQVSGSEFVLAGFVSHNSELKFIENTVIGMPTVASNVEPYYVIEDGKSGMLARDDGQWYFALKALLTDKPQLRKSMLSEARKIVNERFDIQKVALQWAEVLCQ